MRRGLRAGLIAFALAGCVTAASEQRQGDEAAQQVADEIGLVRNGELASYLDAIGAKLAAVSDRPGGPWKFAVADQAEANAFALPGGYVYVTRGLLALLNSEDELACVVGHEMGHVTARHSTKRMGAAIATAPLSIATGLAGAAVGIVSPALGSVVAGTGQAISGGLVIAPFSREQEHEADELGQTLAAKAGYDPAAMSRFLETLDREAALANGGGKAKRSHFFDSHPQTPDRAARTKERAGQLTRAAASPFAASRAAFLAKLDGILVGDDPAKGVFVARNRFFQPEMGLAVDFPDGWKTQNTNEAAAAVSPAEDAVISLRMAAQESSLDKLVAKMTADEPALKVERLKVNGLPAARMAAIGRGQAVEVTLIELGGDVYAVVGQSVESVVKKYASAFHATAGSFRVLSASERASIQESRLRVRAAQAGDTPAGIAKRTGSTWNGERVAVANEVAAGDRFATGFAVKLPLPQAYKSR